MWGSSVLLCTCEVMPLDSVGSERCQPLVLNLKELVVWGWQTHKGAEVMETSRWELQGPYRGWSGRQEAGF